MCHWRIQDFPEKGAPTFPGGGWGAPTYDFVKFSQKNCMKLKEFGPQGGDARPSRRPLDPPLCVVNEIP